MATLPLSGMTYFVLLIQAFPFADGLCHLPGVGGLPMRVSHLPRVCRHHAGPPPPPPPRGGLSLVMSGDDDPEHGSLGDLLSNLANLKNQPVPQTFAQKQAAYIQLFGLIFGLIFGQIFGSVFLGACVYFGLLNVGRGKSLPFPLSIWGAKEKPQVKVKVDLVQVFLALGVVTCVTAGVNTVTQVTTPA